MSAAKVTKADLAELVKRIQGDDATMEQVEAILCGIAAERGEMLGESAEEEAPEAPEPPMADPAMPYADPGAPALADPPPAAALADASGAAAPLADPTPPPAPMAPDPAMADPSVMVATKLMELTGLDAAALLSALEQNADAIKAAFMGGAATQAPVPALSDRDRDDHKLALAVRDENVRTLKSENDAMRTELAAVRKVEAERAVDALLSDGRCTDKMKPQLLALALSDRKRFDEFAATLPQVIPTAPHALSVTPPADPNGSATVDEVDPFVKQLRANLTSAGVRGKAQDDAVRAGVNKRKGNGAQPRA